MPVRRMESWKLEVNLLFSNLELCTTASMSVADFESFCSENPDLRLEYSADGRVLILPLADFETGYRKGEALDFAGKLSGEEVLPGFELDLGLLK